MRHWIQPAVDPHDSPYIFEEGEVNSSYSVNIFEVDQEAGEPTIQILLVGRFEGRDLVVLPQKAWHRKVDRRIMPAGSLLRPTLLEVAACRQSNMEEIVEDTYIKVWVGYLKEEFRDRVQTHVEEFNVTYDFESSQDMLMPSAAALVSAAQEHFAFFSAAEGDPEQEGEEEPMEELASGSQDLGPRVESLEKAMVGMQQGIDQLLALQMEKMVLQDDADPKRKPALKKAGAPSPSGRVSFAPSLGASAKQKAVNPYPSLDPAVVQAAMRAGVDKQSLQEMESLIAKNPKGLKVKETNPMAGDRPLVGGRGRRCWVARSPFRSWRSFAISRSCHFSIGEAHCIGGPADRGQEEEEFADQAGCCPRFSVGSHFRFIGPWTWKEDGSGSTCTTPDVQGEFRGDTSTFGKVDVRRPSLHDSWAKHGNALLECESMGGISFPYRELQNVGSRRVVGSRDSRCPSKWRPPSSTSNVPAVTLTAGSNSNRQRELELQLRFVAGALAAFWIFKPASGAECAGWRAAFQQAVRRKVVNHYNVPSSRPGRFHPASSQRGEDCKGRHRGQGRAGSQEKTKAEAKAESWGNTAAGCMTQERVPEVVPNLDGAGTASAGSSASPIRIPAFLNSLPRWLLQLNCGFRGFLRSILQSQGLDKQPTSLSSSIWPMPPPYPEVFRSGAGSKPGNHLRRLVSLQVVALDWLCLNEAGSAPECIRIGRRLNSRQWSAVKMLEHLGTDGNTPEFIQAGDMGRAAAKMEGFENVLGEPCHAFPLQLVLIMLPVSASMSWKRLL